MKIPPGLTEVEVTESIERALTILAPSHKFGCYNAEDMRQEGWTFALEVLEGESYDPARPLDNFIWTHIKNRFLNLRRNKLRRTDSPCQSCHKGTFCTGENTPCIRYREWAGRNTSKALLMKTVVGEPHEYADNFSVTDEAEKRELLTQIDVKLPMEMRPDYLRLRSGMTLPKGRQDEVMSAVREILGVSIHG